MIENLMNRVKHYSVSSILKWKNCPRSWWADKVLGLTRPSTDAASFGSQYDQLIAYKLGLKPSDTRGKETPIEKQMLLDGVEQAVELYFQQPHAVKKALSLSSDIYPDEVDSSLSEGTKTKVFVNRFERNPKARQACLEHYGYNCQICYFNFEYKYGKIGKDSIHVHHIIPISEIGTNYKVDPIKDLLPVCPNCHLILHKKNAPTVEELKAQLK